MPKTYEPIQTQTVGTATPTVTFSSIPQTYTDLVLVSTVLNGLSTISWRVGNGSVDTGSNYSRTQLTGTGSAASSGRASNESLGYLIPYSTVASQVNLVVHLMNYSNTTTYKTWLIRNNDSADQTMLNVGLWRSTSAINIITLTTGSANLSVGCTFTLYGIKAA